MKMYRMKDGSYINPQFITNLKITAEAKDRGYIVRVVAYMANQTKPVTLYSKRVDASADHDVTIREPGPVCWTGFVPLPGPEDDIEERLAKALAEAQEWLDAFVREYMS